ncbi:MAG: kelch repeat-containing protein [Acidobacteriaceae bacterium]
MQTRLKACVALLAAISVLTLLGCSSGTLSTQPPPTSPPPTQPPQPPPSQPQPIPTQPPPTPTPPTSAPPAPGEWTWISGSNTVNQLGAYGTEDVPAASNVAGGRYGAVTWTGASGSLWLFGGFSIVDGRNLNDLWEYSGDKWTWVGGSNLPGQLGAYGTQGEPAPGNVPGARELAASSVDASGNFWLFGGQRIGESDSPGILDDLWKYSNGEWTWMGGSNLPANPGTAGGFQGTGVYGTLGVAAPGNVPGARYEADSWTDAAGNLWLFGGLGVDSAGNLGLLNDLWKYSNREWTWMSGSDKGDQYGVYGTLGVAAPTNVPGSRSGAVVWTDAADNLWLFGGEGASIAGGCSGSTCVLNDLWKYTVSTNMWTWMGGSDLNNQAGVYGTQGVAAPDNLPPPRENAVGWMDAAGNFWLFGGDEGALEASLNDLWKYSNGKWTWESGSNTPCGAGSYGTQGTPAPGNTPGARIFAVGWADKAGNLWFFGGDDFCNPYGDANYNDLWEYQP